MGLIDNISLPGLGKKGDAPSRPGGAGRPRQQRPSGEGGQAGGRPASGQSSRGRPAGAPPGDRGMRDKLRKSEKGKGKGKAKGGKGGPGDRLSAAAAPLQDRRRRLVAAREATLRDLGGLMLEMYKRNRFREELLLDKCEEVLAIEVEIAHIDQRLFQLAPTNAAGQRPIGRCECNQPILPGQNFCPKCGRAFATLTQTRACTRCGAGLRNADAFCWSCGTQAPDLFEALDAAPPSAAGAITAPAEGPSQREAARAAVTEAIVLDEGLVPPIVDGAASRTAEHGDNPFSPTNDPAEAAATPPPAGAPPAPQPTPAAGDSLAALPPDPPSLGADTTMAIPSAEPAAPAGSGPSAPPPAPAPPQVTWPGGDGQPDELPDTAMGAALDAATLLESSGTPLPLSATTPVDTGNATVGPDGTPAKPSRESALDKGTARKVEKEKARRLKQIAKAREKQRKEQAKARAKAAQERKKRGGGEDG